ncbi:MAG: intradiol ring-cleavage dioxygenase [Polyangiales bacterium]
MDDDQSHHGGLAHDLQVLGAQLSRRRILGLLVGASLIPVIGCGSDADSSVADAGGGTDAGGTPANDSGVPSCSTIPQETAGPYPGDNPNGANALALAGIVRSDIRSSLGTSSTVAEGVPLTIILTLVNASANCAPLADHAIYLWHCDRAGAYSMYSGAAQSENYLRGVQQTDASGQVTFQSIFPACYSGRWPHIHFEVFASLAAATTGRNALRTSQLALPESACNEVFATTGYSASVTNLRQVSLASDNVFSDGASLQVATISGDATTGYTARLVVAVQA